MIRQIMVGAVPIGGGAPVSIQSMTNTKTEDIEATINQIRRLTSVGCQIVRVAVPNMQAAKAVAAIKEQIEVPLVADIHFDYRLALEAIAAGADKIRINPGNIGEDAKVKEVANACTRAGIPIRIGVNGGSLEQDILKKYGEISAEAMVESAIQNVALLNRFDFDDICVSLKTSSVTTTMRAYQLFREQTDYPLHLGVTEAGTLHMGSVKSAVGIGGLLGLGIGDTLRVTLTADPIEEIYVAKDILRVLGMRKDSPELIACPSCGRTDINLIELTNEVEQRLKCIDKPITVAVMGCSVNGPGEARMADVGIAGGKGTGLLFKKGEIIKRVPQEELVDALMELIDTLEK